MKKLCIALLASFIIIAPATYAASFSEMQIFGDSLSSEDGGYWLNGENLWTRFLSNEWLDSMTNYHNHAVQGTKSSEILTSVNNYLTSTSSIDPNGLYIIWGGTNDNSADANAVAEGVRNLEARGARNIMVLNLYDNPLKDNGTIQAFNANLSSLLSGSNANLIQIDTYALLGEILHRYEDFGYSLNDPTSSNGYTENDPVLFDDLHPTTKTQRVLADYIQSIVEAPAIISTLPEVPLKTAYANRSYIYQQLDLLELNEISGKFIPYAKIGNGSADFDASTEVPQFENSALNLFAGLGYSFNEKFFAGLSFHSNSSEIEFSEDKGDFNLSQNNLSLFGKFNYSILTLNFFGSNGSLDYDEINRNAVLDTITRINTGTTSGDYSGFGICANFKIYEKENFEISPFLGYDIHSISIDAYREDGSSSTNMEFSEQERDASICSIGVNISTKKETSIGNLKIYGSAAYESDFEDSETEMEGKLTSASGNMFSMPAYEAETSAFNILVGSNLALNEHINLDLNLSVITGDASSEYIINLGTWGKL